MINGEDTITIPEGQKYEIDPERWVLLEDCSVRNKILVEKFIEQ